MLVVSSLIFEFFFFFCQRFSCPRTIRSFHTFAHFKGYFLKFYSIHPLSMIYFINLIYSHMNLEGLIKRKERKEKATLSCPCSWAENESISSSFDSRGIQETQSARNPVPGNVFSSSANWEETAFTRRGSHTFEVTMNRLHLYCP